MATIDLNLTRAFVAVHETGSFSAAAERLQVPRSTVSRAVAALEAELDLLLFHRTTRKVSTSREGHALYARVAPSLEALERSLREVPAADESPSGTLRVTTTVDIGSVILAEAVARYIARYSAVSVEVRLTTALIDLEKEGFDLALRVAPRKRRDSALVSRKLGEIVLQLYASPSYLARHGEPQSVADIAEHAWVDFHGSPPLRASASKRDVIPTKTRVKSDDMFFCREVLRQGGGLGTLPSFIADADVTAGRQVRVLPRWVAYTGTAFLVQPSRKHVPSRVTAFRDLLLEMLRQRPLKAGAPGNAPNG
jgi:DNA-binding transcriptional LysR family regulator